MDTSQNFIRTNSNISKTTFEFDCKNCLSEINLVGSEIGTDGSLIHLYQCVHTSSALRTKNVLVGVYQN